MGHRDQHSNAEREREICCYLTCVVMNYWYFDVCICETFQSCWKSLYIIHICQIHFGRGKAIVCVNQLTSVNCIFLSKQCLDPEIGSELSHSQTRHSHWNWMVCFFLRVNIFNAWWISLECPQNELVEWTKQNASMTKQIPLYWKSRRTERITRSQKCMKVIKETKKPPQKSSPT